MNILLFVFFLFLIFLQGCHQPSPTMNEDRFKDYVNSNSTVNSNATADPNSSVNVGPIVNSSTSEAQPDPQQPVTLVNAAF